MFEIFVITLQVLTLLALWKVWNWNSLKTFFIFCSGRGRTFWLFWVTWGSLALLGALVDSKWWGKVVNVLFFARLGLF